MRWARQPPRWMAFGSGRLTLGRFGHTIPLRHYFPKVRQFTVQRQLEACVDGVAGCIGARLSLFGVG